MVNLDRYVETCNSVNDLCNGGCVPNKTEDLTMLVFNMTTVITWSKIFTKHMSSKCECEFD